MRVPIFAGLLCFFLQANPFTLPAQTRPNVHIVTVPRNDLGAFSRFHFTVNDKEYRLNPGQCLELALPADTLHLVVKDRRWIKSATDELHVPVTEDMYVWIRVTWKGNLRDVHFGAEIVCKSCFDELKKGCRKTFTE